MRTIAACLVLVATCGAAGATTFTCDAKGKGERLGAASLFVEGKAGWDLGTVPEVNRSSCGLSGHGAFFFSKSVAEGNYRVTVVLGGEKSAVTTVKAEARRLMAMNVWTGAGESVTVEFVVNVRGEEIREAAGASGLHPTLRDGAAKDGAPGRSPASEQVVRRVKLKPREVGNLDWDQKLTLEFYGERPSVRSISIERADAVPVIYLAGDSTVVDQDAEPWAAWGQMLPRFFDERVVVANHAESGETTKSFVSELRLAKILSEIKAGDYLFIQFAHNDQKAAAGITLEIYKAMLKDYVAQARAKGATAVLVTSMHRRTFDADGKITNSLLGYPGAMREVAAEEKVALIDLNAMSKTMWEAMGPEGAKKAFMHYPAGSFAGQEKAIEDDTHFNFYGAYELAKCVVRGIRAAGLPLVSFIRKDVGVFDPARPDAVDGPFD